MPSRYNINNDPCMHDLLRALHVDLGPLPIRYNLAPTDQVPVIHEFEGRRIISDMRWWLVPSWSDAPSTQFPMYNARCENLDTSRAYQASFRYKRCIIPARSYIQWHHQHADKNVEKIPYLISALHSDTQATQAMAFAGVWEYWSDGVEHLLSCAIVTRPALQGLAEHANRMPLMLSLKEAKRWLDHKQDVKVITDLFQSPPPDYLQMTELAQTIGDAKNKNKPVQTGSSTIIFKGLK